MRSHMTQSNSHTLSNRRGSTNPRLFLSPKASHFSSVNSPGGSARLGMWESSKAKEFDEGDDDCNYLFVHSSDKRDDIKSVEMGAGVAQTGSGVTKTTVEGRPGTWWGKEGVEEVELKQLKGEIGTVHVRTDISVTEVRDNHSDSTRSL